MSGSNMDPKTRWLRAMDALRLARKEQRAMNALDGQSAAFQEAEDRYWTACGNLVRELGMLSSTGVLDLMSDFFDVTYGRV